MLREIGAPQNAPAAPPSQYLQEVRERLRAGGSDRKDLRAAPWLFWQGDPPAIVFPGLLDRVVMQAAEQRSTLRNLIEAWLRDFSRDAPRITEAGQAIARLLTTTTDPRLNIWREGQAQFSMFEAETGPAAIAAAILGSSRPPEVVLESLGFDDELRTVGGYMRAIHSECLERLPGLLRGREVKISFSRIASVLLHGGNLRFPAARLDVARSLLRPWTDSQREPLPEAQIIVKDFVLTHIGHPQLRPRQWIGAEAEAAVMRRWLAQASLRVFFGLIADHAELTADQDLALQWPYREAFWSACLKKGFIADAWLALGQRVHASARAKRELGNAFGLLAGSSADQSVLLMRVGNLILAEWSHNGKLRAWPGREAPKLYQASYRRKDFILPGLPFPPEPDPPANTDRSGLVHAGSAGGVWQRRAAALLARHAGITLLPTDWQIR